MSVTKIPKLEECIRKKKILKTRPNPSRALALLKISNLRNEFLHSIGDDKFALFKIEIYYEIIKELLFANLYAEGYASKNHLCLLSFLQATAPDLTYEIEKINELRKVRNSISYRGISIDSEYLQFNELEFRHIIKKLQERLEDYNNNESTIKK